MFKYPSYLTPLSLFGSAQVSRDVTEKTDQDGVQKRSDWADAPGWIIPVEGIVGERTKKMPDGRSASILDTQDLNVTVWSAHRPAVAMGDYVQFEGLAAGAVQGNLFFQATGVKKVTRNV